VEVHADHPTLNARVAELLGRGERLDVISTHSKYAPSQRQWLRSLDDLLPRACVADLAPGATELCRFEGQLVCAPRLVDVRVLWWRTDRMSSAPATWSDLVDNDAVFGFTGRESGLFGLFFELVVGAGGRLFDDDARPVIASPAAVDAVATIVELARRAPTDLPGWHYDEVDTALLDGRLDAAAAWPGGWGAIERSPLAEVLEPAPYPSGPQRRVSYSGCHAWAIPRTCGDLDRTVELLAALLARPAQALDASGGNMVANVDALAAVVPTSEVDARRLAITRTTIAESMITYPALEHFPLIEDAGWRAINAAIRGQATPSEAVATIQAAAEHASPPDASADRDAMRYALQPLTAVESAAWPNEAWPDDDSDWSEVFGQ
jgi:multiple sugar transport system substrate-binding protein